MVRPEPTTKRAGGPSSAMDRLSALPDGLLHAILSFLPARQVVQTCLLSRRWRWLWRSAPRIEINQKDFGITGGINRDTLEERWARFEDFATNLLLFHDNTTSLGEFRLRCQVYKFCHVDRWIRRGIEYCPAVLHIQIWDYAPGFNFKLPPAMESCFPCLKRLSLWHAILDSRFTGSLSSACPFLECLDLQGCEFVDISPQGIKSSTLDKLVIGYCSNKTSRSLVITAPSLTYLCLHGCYQAGISLCKMDSLVKAEIHITEFETMSDKYAHELLGSLSKVTSLKLVGLESEVMLNKKSDELSIFHNLRTLDLHSCFLDDCELNEKLEALGSFLQNAPCLEKLILQYSMFNSFSDSEWEIERKNITLHRWDGKTLQCPKLKLVEIIYDHDHDHQLIELVWSLARSLPDASIKLNKIERS